VSVASLTGSIGLYSDAVTVYSGAAGPSLDYSIADSSQYLVLMVP